MPKVRTAARTPRTIQDVARLAQVSAGTVSRVLHDHPAVNPAMRERVRAAIKTLDYQPNAIAQSMRMSATHLVGCLVSDISNPFYASVLKSVELAMAEAGYTLLIASTDNRIDREIALLGALASRRVDGLIAVPSDERDKPLLRAYAQTGIPLVLMEREMRLQADAVVTDHRSGTEAATAHLLGLGHRRVALITGLPTNRSGRDRIGGYRAALADAGVPADAALVCAGGLGLDDGFAATRRLLALRRPPTAIIAAGNHLLAGVLRALTQAGLTVPDDLSVLSAGDSELAELAATPIGVIRWDLAAFGQEVANLLLDRIRTPSVAPRRTVMPTELVMRASCGPPRSLS